MDNQQLLNELKELKDTGLVVVFFNSDWTTGSVTTGQSYRNDCASSKRVFINISEKDKLGNVKDKIEVAKKELTELIIEIEYRKKSPVLYEFLRNNLEP